jgi:hypothetical protein
LIELRPESPDELRNRLREMSDLELRRFGQRARKPSDPKKNFGAEPHVRELEEATAEWRMRHPVDPNRAGRNSRLCPACEKIRNAADVPRPSDGLCFAEIAAQSDNGWNSESGRHEYGCLVLP